MNDTIVVASGDAALTETVAHSLTRAGFAVTRAPTNLALVWRLAARGQRPPAAIVLDARRRAFGRAPLEWLREESTAPLIVLADDGDIETFAAAQQAGAASVLIGKTAAAHVATAVAGAVPSALVATLGAAAPTRRPLALHLPPRVPT